MNQLLDQMLRTGERIADSDRIKILDKLERLGLDTSFTEENSEMEKILSTELNSLINRIVSEESNTKKMLGSEIFAFLIVAQLYKKMCQSVAEVTPDRTPDFSETPGWFNTTVRNKNSELETLKEAIVGIFGKEYNIMIDQLLQEILSKAVEAQKNGKAESILNKFLDDIKIDTILNQVYEKKI